MTRNIQLLIAYDGTDFHGWQTQQDLRTVQAEIEGVLQRVVRHRVDLIASGRTDAGVHAAGQVANFHTDSTLTSDKLHHAIESRLALDISLLGVRDVPAGFQATRSATGKMYRYRICNTSRRPARDSYRYVYHYRKPLDVALMRQGGRAFVGTQDFKAMVSTSGQERPTTVRTVLGCDVHRTTDEIRIDVRGTGFLYNQVRNMVGTLIEVGRGRWPADRVAEILASGDRQNAGPTAPAQGLWLQWVQYPPDHLIADNDEQLDAADRSQPLEVGP